MTNRNSTQDRSHKSRPIWSIGIYTGTSLFELAPPPDVINPVLSAADVTDVDCLYVADPFMICVDGTWHMFFEVVNLSARKGEIGLATSPDGQHWTYRQIVLAEPFHLSYPCVFSWQGDYYMIPETLAEEAVILYHAVHFPTQWRRVGPLIAGVAADPTIFRYDDRWWLFLCSAPLAHDTLKLYSSTALFGGWREHPASPVVTDNAALARPAGRIESENGQLLRCAQDCSTRYGELVRAIPIGALTPTRYQEEPARQWPILRPSGQGWNASGMHHIDFQVGTTGQYIACVDGDFLAQP